MKVDATVSHEVIAWRGWRLVEHNKEPMLQSVTQDDIWEGPTLVAHRAPRKRGATGIYALKEKPAPCHWQADYFRRGVYGTVALSGIVVEGDNGYRAQKATVRELWLGALWSNYGAKCRCEVVKRLMDRYQVEVHDEGSDIIPFIDMDRNYPEVAVKLDSSRVIRGIVQTVYVEQDLSRPYTIVTIRIEG